jgi:hypothetical protein
MASQPRVAPRLAKLALSSPWALIELSLRDGRGKFDPIAMPENHRFPTRMRDQPTCVGRPYVPLANEWKSQSPTCTGEIALVREMTVSPLSHCRHIGAALARFSDRVRGRPQPASVDNTECRYANVVAHTELTVRV